MESHAVEAAEDAGGIEVEWLPFELRPAPQAAARAARRPPARRLDAARLPARALARDRDPPAALPAALDAAARRVPVGGRRRAGCAPFKHALYEAFFCEGEDIATDPEIRAGGRAGRPRPRRGDRGRLLAGAHRPDRARSAAKPRRRGSAACRRSWRRTASTTGAWAASSACSRASRSCRARTSLRPFETRPAEPWHPRSPPSLGGEGTTRRPRLSSLRSTHGCETES